MKQLKKVTVAMAMAMVVGTASIPAASVMAATTSCTQSQSSCDFTKGKLCYTITGNNTCTVSGLSAKGENSTSCTIPSSVTCNGTTYNVTKVAANAFKNCDNLQSVKVSNNITTIGKNAFAGCNSLSKVSLGNNVNKVCSNAFNNCTSLNSIKSFSNITSAGSNCFGNATLSFPSCSR